MNGSRQAEVLLPFHTATALRKPQAMARAGIRSLEGPVKNGPLYQRYGVFPYLMEFQEEAYQTLLRQEFPLGRTIGDLFMVSEQLGFQLLLKVSEPTALVGMIQLVGYKHDRQKPNTPRKELLGKIYHELKKQSGSEAKLTTLKPPSGALH